jgi:hypothetical protein
MGPELVNNLDGSEQAKQRLKVILQTFSGEMTIPEACQQLHVSEARFHELRSQWLQSSVANLEPKPVGRPPAPEPSEQDQKIANLERQIVELKVDLRAAQIREELALLMPEVMESRNPKEQDRRRRLEALEAEWGRQQDEKKSPLSGAKSSIPNASGKSAKL